MSYDLIVYLPDVGLINQEQCTEYLNRFDQFDMNVEMYPEVDFSNHAGWLPFCVELSKAPDYLMGKRYHSGFEYYLDEFAYHDVIGEIKDQEAKMAKRIPISQRVKKWFRGTPSCSEKGDSGRECKGDVERKVTDSQEIWMYDAETDVLIAQCNYFITLCIHFDLLQPRVAFLFAAYLVDCCEGVFIDPQFNDVVVTQNAAETLYKMVKDTEEETFHPKKYRVILFEDWEQVP